MTVVQAHVCSATRDPVTHMGYFDHAQPVRAMEETEPARPASALS